MKTAKPKLGKRCSGDLVRAAADCGIDARNMTLDQVREAYRRQKEGDKYSDQFDVRLEEAIRFEEIVRKRMGA